MAAAMVSGGAALLLQSTPSLTPRHVKVALQVTAEFMPEAGLVAGGTGSVNLYCGAQDGVRNDGLLGVLSSADRRQAGDRIRFRVPEAGRAAGSVKSGLTRVFGLIDARKPGWSSRCRPRTPSQIIWGDTNMWTADQQIIWGDQIFNPAGQQIIWGDQIYNPTRPADHLGRSDLQPERPADHLGRSRHQRRPTRSSGATALESGRWRSSGATPCR